MIPLWIQALVDHLRGKIPRDFVGQVEVNVFKGGISNVNVKQSFKEAGDEPNHKSDPRKIQETR